MAKGNGKRATRKRARDVSAAARDEAEKLARATARRLAKLEKDLAAARKTEERHRSRLAAASAEADRIRIEIAELVRHASEPAVGGVKKVGHAAGDLLEDAADVVTDAAGAVRDAAGSVVGVARRAVRSKRATAKAPAPAKPAAPRTRRASPTTPPATGPDNG